MVQVGGGFNFVMSTSTGSKQTVGHLAKQILEGEFPTVTTAAALDIVAQLRGDERAVCAAARDRLARNFFGLGDAGNEEGEEWKR
jgi:predicted transcriptional regulator